MFSLQKDQSVLFSLPVCTEYIQWVYTEFVLEVGQAKNGNFSPTLQIKWWVKQIFSFWSPALDQSYSQTGFKHILRRDY